MNQTELFEETRVQQPANYAEHKVQLEIHRLQGFLRFTPDSRGIFVARCSPDYYILPALAGHFTRRFGETPWAIIDEKRGQCLYKVNNKPAAIAALNGTAKKDPAIDPWEEFWRLYHSSISIESRKNPRLQLQSMPKRYHKYLPEI